MGIGPGSRCKSSPYAVEDSNPDPKNWNLLKQKTVISPSGQQVLVVKVNYPNAKNFEGDKVMVYIGFASFEQLATALGGKVDPHFEPTRLAPVARFRPDEFGWKLAKAFAKIVP